MDWIWILWCILGAILIVAEIFTTGSCCSGLGSARSRLPSRVHRDRKSRDSVSDLCGRVDGADRALANDLHQLLFTREDGQSLRSGVDALPGKIGLSFRRAKERCRKAR
jgi:hypothetical protein